MQVARLACDKPPPQILQNLQHVLYDVRGFSTVQPSHLFFTWGLDVPSLFKYKECATRTLHSVGFWNIQEGLINHYVENQ